GHIFTTVEDFTRQELVLGDRARSGGQLDAFHAVFGPTGPDGYPAKLWDPRTGAINPDVARHWQENYDLTAILKRDWKTLGDKLAGKLHITMGTKDTFYLDNAVYLMEDFLESTELPGNGPYYAGSVEYGNNRPHCYAGDLPSGASAEEHYLPIFSRHMRAHAPKDADTKSWTP
ncbi:MAG: hypothetical protein GY953_05505, partial [bacterium]|nr:hypothetical protein [bacterium]